MCSNCNQQSIQVDTCCGTRIHNVGPQCDDMTFLNQCGKEMKFVAISPICLSTNEEKDILFVGANLTETEDQFVAFLNQNQVTLTQSVLRNTKVKVFKNGLKLREGADFTFLDNIISFTNLLSNLDRIDVFYFVNTY
jgi:hypothetical protein